MTHPQQDVLDVALEAARVAGQILRARQSQTREIKYKGPRDIVTDADFAANRAIRSIIERRFPTHTILSEEDPQPARRGEFLWIVDPLDGTTNYARGIPIFAVSIGLARRGRVEVGVVYDPVRDECFSATRGGGAFLNGARIHASSVASLDHAVIGHELTREAGGRARGLNWFTKIATQSLTARIGGSAALSLCYIGAGRLDGYLHLSLSPWDVPAAMIILREAGARITHLDGRAATIRGGAYIAGNAKIFPMLLDAVKLLESGTR